MREVAQTHGVTTSTVSQQIAALAREVGTPLVEPDGRRVRLTPAGRRLAEHAVRVLAAVEEARLDLAPDAEPSGVVRVASFATGVRRSLLPVVRTLAADHPRVRVVVQEQEPREALALLAADEVDLALTYDYDLAPATADPALVATPLWSTAWGLGVPAGSSSPGAGAGADGCVEVVGRFREHDWIVNSRHDADEQAVRTLAALAGFVPRVTHRADSLDLLQDMVVAGLGVGLLPVDQPGVPGVALVPLEDPGTSLRAVALTRLGRQAWPPLALVLRLLAQTANSAVPTG